MPKGELAQLTVPLTALPAVAAERLEELGAPAAAMKVPLYRAIASQPDVVMGWIEFSWLLRAVTSRRLRELMIIRTVTLANCESKRTAHVEHVLVQHKAVKEVAIVGDPSLCWVRMRWHS